MRFWSSQKRGAGCNRQPRKKGKASDCNGVRAEDIEACSEKTKEMTRQIFNEILKQEDCTPTTWRRIRIKVIHKKGDVEEAGNYMPICTLPALYKLFSTFLCNRLCPRLDRVQPEDQGGLRRSFQTLDHLAGLKIAEQKCQEWGVKMWISTVDFMKAFDSISHSSLWDALGHCEIEPQYGGILKRLYERQKRSVLTDKESNVFETEKVTKQGDPLSKSLLNTVLRVALKDDLAKWQRKGSGIRI